MKSNFAGGLLLAGCLTASLLAQMPEGYLDVYVAKVKMGKRAEFDSLNKKEVDANRRNKGDNWLAYELTYGEANTVYYVTARYLRTVVVHVRPGKTLDCEAHLKLNKTASEKANPGIAMLVSQTQAGQALGTYYITTLVKSLADVDQIKPLQEVLGSGYERYLRAIAEDVTSTQILIGKFLPEISNPPDEIVDVDPKFWRPAPPMAAKPAEPKK